MNTDERGAWNAGARRWRRLGLCVALALAGCTSIESRSPAPPVRGQRVRTPPQDGGATSGRAPRPGKPTVELSSTRGTPGQTVSFSATLRTGGATVAGVQNDIQFDPVHTPLAVRAGKPRCTVNPALGKNATAFALQPSKCSGRSCTGMRALVLSVTDTRPIADGAVLYTCTVQIPPTARPGTYPLAISRVAMSTPNGQEIPNATGVAGAITITAR